MLLVNSCPLGFNVSLESRGAHVSWASQYYMAMICEKTIYGKVFSKKCVFDRHQRSKGVKFPTKLLIFSRKYPEAQKLEQLEQNRKKHLKAHLTATNVSL